MSVLPVNKDLEVAVVGCGYVSDNHIRSWNNVGANVAAVCDKNVSAAQSKSREWEIPKYYESVSRMIKEENLDVVSICTPPQVRSAVVTPIMNKGIHVVIEKPLALSITEAEKMIKSQRKNEAKLTVVHCWLFAHVIKKTLGILERKEIGEVLGAEIDVLNTPADPMTSNPSHWCHSLKGGRFAEMLPHPLYLLQAILGDLKVRFVLGSKLGDYDWMQIDDLRILLEDSKHRIASIYASFNAPRTDVTLQIYGTHGILDVDTSRHTIIKRRYREAKVGQVIKDNSRFLGDFISSSFSIASAILTRQYQNMHTTFMKKFVNSLENNLDPPVTAKEALQVTKTFEDLCSRIAQI